MMQEQVSITFINTLPYPFFPEVTLGVDGTTLIAVTMVSDKYLRTVMDMNRIQEAVEHILGKFNWQVERDMAMRLYELLGERELARVP